MKMVLCVCESMYVCVHVCRREGNRKRGRKREMKERFMKIKSLVYRLE